MDRSNDKRNVFWLHKTKGRERGEHESCHISIFGLKILPLLCIKWEQPTGSCHKVRVAVPSFAFGLRPCEERLLRGGAEGRGKCQPPLPHSVEDAQRAGGRAMHTLPVPRLPCPLLGSGFFLLLCAVHCLSTSLSLTLSLSV